jgi:hypothetical protein
MIQRDLPEENNQMAEDLFKPAISRPFQNGVGTGWALAFGEGRATRSRPF